MIEAPQMAHSLLNDDFSAALEANTNLCSLVGWPTDGGRVFYNFLTVFRLRWDDPGSIQEGPGGSQEPLKQIIIYKYHLSDIYSWIYFVNCDYNC